MKKNYYLFFVLFFLSVRGLTLNITPEASLRYSSAGLLNSSALFNEAYGWKSIDQQEKFLFGYDFKLGIGTFPIDFFSLPLNFSFYGKYIPPHIRNQVGTYATSLRPVAKLTSIWGFLGGMSCAVDLFAVTDGFMGIELSAGYGRIYWSQEIRNTSSHTLDADGQLFESTLLVTYPLSASMKLKLGGVYESSSKLQVSKKSGSHYTKITKGQTLIISSSDEYNGKDLKVQRIGPLVAFSYIF